jgi:hypothetical protein
MRLIRSKFRLFNFITLQIRINVIALQQSGSDAHNLRIRFFANERGVLACSLFPFFLLPLARAVLKHWLYPDQSRDPSMLAPATTLKEGGSRS